MGREGREESDLRSSQAFTSAAPSHGYFHVRQLYFPSTHIQKNTLCGITHTFETRQEKERRGKTDSLIPDCSLIMHHVHDFCSSPHMMYIKKHFIPSHSLLHTGLGSQWLQITWSIKEPKQAGYWDTKTMAQVIRNSSNKQYNWNKEKYWSLYSPALDSSNLQVISCGSKSNVNLCCTYLIISSAFWCSCVGIWLGSFVISFMILQWSFIYLWSCDIFNVTCLSCSSVTYWWCCVHCQEHLGSHFNGTSATTSKGGRSWVTMWASPSTPAILVNLGAVALNSKGLDEAEHRSEGVVINRYTMK